MSIDQDFREAHEYRQDRARRARDRHHKTVIATAIEEAHEAISVGDREEIEILLEDTLLPLLGIEDPFSVSCIRFVIEQEDVDLDLYPLMAVVRKGADAVPMRELLDAVAIVEEIARVLRHDSSTLENRQEVRGLETALGVRYLNPESGVGGDLEVYDEEDDLRAILFAGSQGAGKTTARKTLMEDRIAAGHKVIDVIDFHKAENSTWDLESEHEALRKWRDRLELDVGFADDLSIGMAWLLGEDPPEAYYPPDVEILAPLTPGLDRSRIPINDTTGETSVTPFTIPASELSYRQLIMLLPHTTKTHEGYLKAAHQKLSSSVGDWTLKDMAEMVRTGTNAGDKVADRIARSLDTAQQKSFIRDLDSDHRLDWKELMADSGVVSCFTVHTVKEHSDKLLVVSYLLDKLYETRNKMLSETRDIEEYPVLTLGLGELHSVAPRHKAEQDIESTIEGYMIDTLSDLFALMRHANIEVIADTQRFHQQLSPDVSTLFHEIYAFNGQKPDVKKIFQTRTDTTDPVEDVAQYDIGVCSLVSGEGYILPIRFAPPRSHHLDAKRDGDGLSYRARRLEDVELKPAPWSADIPERLAFGNDLTDLERFFSECVEYTNDGHDRIYRDRLVLAYQRWRSDGDRNYQDNYIKEKIKDHFGLDASETITTPRIHYRGQSRRSTADKGMRLVPEAFSDDDREYLFGDGWESRVWDDLDDKPHDVEDAEENEEGSRS